MATDRQLEVLADLESAALAIEAEGIEPGDVTIGLFCERAGHAPQNIRPIAAAFEKHEDWANLSRMKRAFEKAGKVPSWLDEVEHVPLRLENPKMDLPPTARARKAQIAEIAIQDGDQDEVLAAVNVMIKTLAPLTRMARERVISTTSTFYAVGH